MCKGTVQVSWWCSPVWPLVLFAEYSSNSPSITLPSDSLSLSSPVSPCKHTPTCTQSHTGSKTPVVGRSVRFRHVITVLAYVSCGCVCVNHIFMYSEVYFTQTIYTIWKGVAHILFSGVDFLVLYIRAVKISFTVRLDFCELLSIIISVFFEWFIGRLKLLVCALTRYVAAYLVDTGSPKWSKQAIHF